MESSDSSHGGKSGNGIGYGVSGLTMDSRSPRTSGSGGFVGSTCEDARASRAPG